MNRRPLYRLATLDELAVAHGERRSPDRIASMTAPKVRTPKPPKGAKRKAKR